jgi:hypothetical protein
VAKFKLSLRARRFDDIVMNQEQSKTALAEFDTKDFCRFFQKGSNP